MRLFRLAPLLILLVFGCASASPRGQAGPCDASGRCPSGLTCVRYYGIAGARGPHMSSCEIPCRGAHATCPEGQSCVTIADGPGRVCRPKKKP